MVVNMANMIETRLKAQVKLSNIKYSVFATKLEQSEAKYQYQLQFGSHNEDTSTPISDADKKGNVKKLNM